MSSLTLFVYAMITRIVIVRQSVCFVCLCRARERDSQRFRMHALFEELNNCFKAILFRVCLCNCVCSCVRLLYVFVFFAIMLCLSCQAGAIKICLYYMYMMYTGRVYVVAMCVEQ